MKNYTTISKLVFIHQKVEQINNTDNRMVVKTGSQTSKIYLIDSGHFIPNKPLAVENFGSRKVKYSVVKYGCLTV